MNDYKFDEYGLLTGIVQDATTKDVLMVAMMNQEAINQTFQTGFAHFWSRSRQTLWKKGETSGNLLRVQSIFVDCDRDALLLFVEPDGPACHTGNRTCFYTQFEVTNAA